MARAPKGKKGESNTGLFADLAKAVNVQELVTVIENFQTERSVAWRPVGGRENNLATINIGSDPAAGLVERITNAIDAVLEREWVAEGEPTNVRSPREAVEEWFGIDEGRVTNIESARKFDEVSRNVVVTLLDSGLPAKPTVDIRDKGIGILAEDIGSTILSLNATKKLKKFFLAGAFGQGGSTALSYSEFTVIMSRRQGTGPDGTPHPVAVTIVSFDEGDVDRDKHGVYEYMIDHKTGHPFTFDVPLDDFEPGTLVRHVSMDLGKYAAMMTAPVKSLWYLTHHYMFDPVLPFRVEEQRENKSKGQNRFVGGNFRRLSRNDSDDKKSTQYDRQATLTFRTGSVTITWWVLVFEKPEQKSNPRDFIKNYVSPGHPIIITYNGQKQGELPNTIIKDDLGLPYLERFLIVHVDCDELDNESRRQLFPTTREHLRDTSLLDELRVMVLDALKGDDNLQVLDRQRRQRYLERVDDESVENLRKRLASRVKMFTKSAPGGVPVPPADREPGTDTPHTPKPSIPPQEPPTFLEITTNPPKKVHSGRSFNLKFKTDAHPAYFVDADAFIAVITPPSVGQYTGTTTVRDGYGAAFFRLADDVEPGTTAEITLELRPKGTKSLSDAIVLEVVPVPETGGAGEGEEQTPNINPRFIDRNHPFYVDNGWDETYVAEVERGTDSIDVFVSRENKRLNKLINRAQRAGTAQVKALGADLSGRRASVRPRMGVEPRFRGVQSA